MLIWVAFLVILSSGQVFYHFGNSFGQVFRDKLYSSSRVAVSGSSSSIDSLDIVPTDRGAYIPHHSAGIRVYPNDISSETTLISGAFSAAIWYLVTPSSDGIIFIRKSNAGGYIYADHFGYSKKFYVSVSGANSAGAWTNVFTINPRNCHSASWLLFGIIIDVNQVKIFTNNSPLSTLSLPSPYIETSVEQNSIGSAGSFFGTVGFIWYYHHVYTVSLFDNFIHQSSSTACFYSGCNECNPSIVDPVLAMTGCTSYQTDPYSSSSGACSQYCSSGVCIGTICLDCSCSPSMCVLSSSQLICDCLPGTSLVGSTCLCTQSNYYTSGAACLKCRQDCLTCANGVTCLTCVDIHAQPGDNGCACKEGFFESGILSQGGTCVACDSQCLTCTSSSCITCISTNSKVNSLGGCSCLNGYYALIPKMSDVNSCQICHSHCSTCLDASSCETCIVNGAVPLTVGCGCSDGFYPSGPLDTTSTICLSCLSFCSTCLDGESCVKCLASNSMPDTGSICVCSPGFYQSDVMNVPTACSQCHLDCSTCSDPDICITCLSLNSTPRSDSGCYCDEGFFRIDGSEMYSCEACSSDCKTCDQLGLCLSCKNTLSVVSPSSGCDCIDGYYKSVSGNDYSCLACREDCKLCSSGTSCSTCKVLGASFNGVKCECPQGFFPGGPMNSLSTTCSPCDSSCLSCTNTISCTQCTALNSITDNSGVCKCLAGFYQSSSMSLSSACTSCHPDCKTCSEASLCLTCKASFSSPDNSSGCFCDSGYYRSVDTNGDYLCVACSSDCLTCSSSLICDKCLVTTAVPLNTGCQCPSLTFATGPLSFTSTICSGCLNECLSCSDSQSCTQCIAANTFIDSYGRCTCVQGYFASSSLSTTNACSLCNTDCLTCNDFAICLTCIDSNSSPSPSSGCVCNSGYYRNNGLNGIYTCVACSSECATCRSLGSCDSCKAIYAILSNGQCICPTGYGGVSPLTSSTSCFQCGIGCSSCDSSNPCLSCFDINSFISSSGVCQCFAGYYQNPTSSTTFTCLPCHSHCKTCINALKCLSCKTLNSQPDLTSGCICMTGFYPISSDFTLVNSCAACNINCTSCLNETFCTSCSQNFYLNSSSCLECHPTCLGCQDKNLCLACKDSNASQSLEGCECKKQTYYNITQDLCMPCLNICDSCNSSTSCLTCKSTHSFLPLCQDCDKSCLKCFGSTLYECSSCNSSLLLKTICSESCPLGFINSSGVCEIETPNYPTLKFLFQGLGDTFFDVVNGLEAEGKTRRRLTSTLPFAVYQRGLYFPGNSFLEIKKNDSKILNIDFSVSFWFRPLNRSSTVFSKYSQDFQVNSLKLFVEDSMMKGEIFLENFTFSYSSGVKLNIEYWNHVYFTCNHSLNTSIMIWVNNKQGPFVSLSDFPFIDTDSSVVFIGDDVDGSSPFFGFVYNIEVYGNYLSIDRLVSDVNCLTCDVCFADKTCINLCDVGQVYVERSGKCVSCPDECPNSCKDTSTCLSCVDDDCEFCNSYESNSCYQCLPGFEVQNKTCEICSSTTFYDAQSLMCVPCPVLCQTCSSLSTCLTCSKSSSLTSYGQCNCNQGYSLTLEKCFRNRFSVQMTINQKNEITLWFSENLSSDLKPSFLTLHLDNLIVSFSIEKIDMKTFRLIFALEKVSKNSIVEVFFLEEITSKSNSLLEVGKLSKETVLTDSLKEELSLLKQAKTSKEMGKTGATAGVSVAVGLSFMNFDPTSFFDFMNTAEMFYSVCLFNFELNPVLSEFLMGLRIHNQIPKLFSLFIDVDQGVEVNEKYRKFGYSSNLFLINTAVHLQVLLIIFALGLIVWIVTRIGFLKEKLQFLMNIFRYKIFLRFWLQTFFELSTAVGLSLRMSKKENWTQRVDYAICCIFVVSFNQGVEISGILLFLHLIKKRSRMTDEEEIKGFVQKYGTFFEEFKDEGLKDWLFYFIYILRRLMIQISYQFIDDGAFQLAFSIMFSFLIPLYIVTVQGFKTWIYNVYHFFNEILIGVYHAVILVSFIEGVSGSSEKLTDICMKIILGAWILNIVISISNTIKAIVYKVRDIMAKRKEKKNDHKFKTHPEPQNGNELKVVDF